MDLLQCHTVLKEVMTISTTRKYDYFSSNFITAINVDTQLYTHANRLTTT